MAPAGLTHARLATKLIVEGCLAAVAGNPQGQMPIAATLLTDLERSDIGLKQTGNTVFYPLPPTGVFFDMDGAVATVWFMQADSDKALGLLEAELKRAYPRAKQLKDGAHPVDQAMRMKSYEVDFGNSRVALVEIDYPARGSLRFTTRVVAQKRGR